jgi:hypothetical protein
LHSIHRLSFFDRTGKAKTSAIQPIPKTFKTPTLGKALAVIGLLILTVTLAGLWNSYDKKQPVAPRYVLSPEGRVIPNPVYTAKEPVETGKTNLSSATSEANRPGQDESADNPTDIAAPTAQEESFYPPAEDEKFTINEFSSAQSQQNLDPETAREQTIEDLLALAEQSLADDRLTTPRENSAFYYYQQVLQLDPNNFSALQGMNEIALRYARLAENQIEKQHYSEARYLIQRGLSIDPYHPKLLALQNQVEESVMEHTPRAVDNSSFHAPTPNSYSLSGFQNK